MSEAAAGFARGVDPDAGAKPRTATRQQAGVRVPRWLPGPVEWGLIGLAFGLSALGVIAGMRTRVINSDDVALQNILLAWSKGEPHGAYAGSDNFLLHFPVYWASAALVSGPWRQLVIQSVIFNGMVVLGLIVLLRQLAQFSRRTRSEQLIIGYLPVLLWAGQALVPLSGKDPVGTDAYAFITRLNINLRHLETGLWLLLLAALVVLLTHRGRRWVAIAGILGVGVAMGLIFFSDPLFLYIGGGAYAATVLLGWSVRRLSHRQALLGFGALGIGLVVFKLIAVPIRAWGLWPVSIVTENVIEHWMLPTNTANTLKGWLTLLHADLAGVPVNDRAMVPLGFNLVFALLLLVAAGFGVRRFLRGRRLLELHLVLLAVLSVLALTFTPNGANTINARYLYVGVVALVPMTSLALLLWLRRAPRLVGLIAAMLGVAVLLNGVANALGLSGPRTSDVSTRQLIRTLKQNGLTKGYVNYWTANPITFYSDREVIALPLACLDPTGPTQELRRYNWLVNQADFDKPAERTFIIVDQAAMRRDTDGKCLGRLPLPTPERVIQVGADAEIRVYPGDIGKQWPLFRHGN